MNSYCVLCMVYINVKIVCTSIFGPWFYNRMIPWRLLRILFYKQKCMKKYDPTSSMTWPTFFQPKKSRRNFDWIFYLFYIVHKSATYIWLIYKIISTLLEHNDDSNFQSWFEEWKKPLTHRFLFISLTGRCFFKKAREIW